MCQHVPSAFPFPNFQSAQNAAIFVTLLDCLRALDAEEILARNLAEVEAGPAKYGKHWPNFRPLFEHSLELSRTVRKWSKELEVWDHASLLEQRKYVNRTGRHPGESLDDA